MKLLLLLSVLICSGLYSQEHLPKLTGAPTLFFVAVIGFGHPANGFAIWDANYIKFLSGFMNIIYFHRVMK